MQSIIIREALAEDAEQLIAFTNSIGKESDNLSFGAEGLSISLEQEKKFLRDTQMDASSLYLIACDHDEIIASGNLTGMPRRMRHRAEIGLSVKKNYWHQGIGTALMRKLIQYAKEHDIEILQLEVRKDNRNAIHLYETFGFQHIGTFPAYFKIEESYIDFTLMYLDLR